MAGYTIKHRDEFESMEGSVGVLPVIESDSPGIDRFVERYENEITEEQAADALSVPLRTLQRDSAKARGLLKHIARSGRG